MFQEIKVSERCQDNRPGILASQPVCHVSILARRSNLLGRYFLTLTLHIMRQVGGSSLLQVTWFKRSPEVYSMHFVLV